MLIWLFCLFVCCCLLAWFIGYIRALRVYFVQLQCCIDFICFLLFYLNFTFFLFCFVFFSVMFHFFILFTCRIIIMLIHTGSELSFLYPSFALFLPIIGIGLPPLAVFRKALGKFTCVCVCCVFCVFLFQLQLDPEQKCHPLQAISLETKNQMKLARLQRSRFISSSKQEGSIAW